MLFRPVVRWISKKVAGYARRNTFAFLGNMSGDVDTDVKVGFVTMYRGELGYSVEEISKPEEVILFFDYPVETSSSIYWEIAAGGGLLNVKFRSQ